MFVHTPVCDHTRQQWVTTEHSLPSPAGFIEQSIVRHGCLAWLHMLWYSYQTVYTSCLLVQCSVHASSLHGFPHTHEYDYKGQYLGCLSLDDLHKQTLVTF